MVRATLDNRKEYLQVGDRYFVRSSDPTSFERLVGGVDEPEIHYLETEATGKPLVEILADLRLAGSL